MCPFPGTVAHHPFSTCPLVLHLRFHVMLSDMPLEQYSIHQVFHYTKTRLIVLRYNPYHGIFPPQIIQ